ncbi:MAG: tetratricopeptide repeat protein [Pseudomonadota bacterium]
MQPILKRLTMLCAGSLLLACASPTARAPSAARVSADAEQAYLIGRSYHMAMRPQQALAYYRSALEGDPGHLRARNGLAVLHAEQGRMKEAISLWQELAASKDGREKGFLLGNLGYAHLIDGEPARALAVLEQACLLDPLNARAWQHLGDALERTGQHERALAMHRQAESLRGHDLRSDYALAPQAGVAAIDSAVRSNVKPDAQWAQTDIVQGAGGMFVMRRVEAQRAVPVTQPAAKTEVTVRPMLEIRNGNGITGMARSMARSLGEGGPRVVRLSNQKGFGVKRTRVEYQPAFRNAAELLAARIGTVQVVPAATSDRADLRLVLGRDPAGTARPAVAVLPTPPAKSS